MDAREAELDLVRQIRTSRARLEDDISELEHRLRGVARTSRSVARSLAIGGAVALAMVLFVPRFFRLVRRTYAPFT
jgi:hypothetical protein